METCSAFTGPAVKLPVVRLRRPRVPAAVARQPKAGPQLGGRAVIVPTPRLRPRSARIVLVRAVGGVVVRLGPVLPARRPRRATRHPLRGAPLAARRPIASSLEAALLVAGPFDVVQEFTDHRLREGACP